MGARRGVGAGRGKCSGGRRNNRPMGQKRRRNSEGQAVVGCNGALDPFYASRSFVRQIADFRRALARFASGRVIGLRAAVVK